jgi:hypothetical protein
MAGSLAGIFPTRHSVCCGCDHGLGGSAWVKAPCRRLVTASRSRTNAIPHLGLMPCRLRHTLSRTRPVSSVRKFPMNALPTDSEVVQSNGHRYLIGILPQQSHRPVRWRFCRGRLQTRINTRVRGNFRLGELLPTQDCMITFYAWYPRTVLRAGPRACPSSFASESISRTFPDTRQRHGGFVGLARRFS